MKPTHVSMPFLCAQTDTPFVAFLERRGDRYHYRRAKALASSGEAATTSGESDPATILGADELVWTGFACPICHGKREDFVFVECGSCGNRVCVGNATGKLWRCVERCGDTYKFARMGTTQSYAADELATPQRNTPKRDTKAPTPSNSVDRVAGLQRITDKARLLPGKISGGLRRVE